MRPFLSIGEVTAWWLENASFRPMGVLVNFGHPIGIKRREIVKWPSEGWVNAVIPETR